ncbi:SDR family oxidoreductase [Arthrobacter sp. SD76]|uniref:SDR family oxidoreductase n=1 Tax=Arthrobacter sp. SD76 TaxID=3415007 RepID=UPI003C78F597
MARPPASARQSAKALAAECVQIIAAGRNQERLNELAGDPQGRGEATGRVTDITALEDARALGPFALDTFGTIDIPINNAGLMLFSHWSDLAIDYWEKMIDTNIKGYL